MELTEKEILDIIEVNRIGDLAPIEKLSPNAVTRFNELYSQFIKKFPNYDPMAVEDYEGPEDSEFLDMLEKVVNIDGNSLLEGLLPNFQKFDIQLQ